MRIPLTNIHVGKVQMRASYSDGVTELLLRQARGLDNDATQIAASEFAIGLISRCLAMAELDPALPYVSPGYLADVGRRLMTNGNAVAAIQIDQRGVTLLPASGFDVRGAADPDTWYYRMTLPGPTRQANQTLAGSSVVHCRMNPGPTQPWLGSSPLIHAGVSATAVARVEKRLSEEANSRVGYLLPYRDLSDPQRDDLKAGVENLAGNVGLVHSQQHAFDSRGSVGGSADYSPRRFGMQIPEANVKVRRDLVLDTVAALGVPPALFEANTGTGAQEAFRQFYVSTLEPIGAVVSHELAMKLDRPGLMLHLDRVSGSDIARRATGLVKLKEAGVDDAVARRIAGVR